MSEHNPEALFSELKMRGEALGLFHMGVAEATALEEEARYLRTFLEAGRHGQMGWLENTEMVRVDPRHEGMLEGATRVVVFATPYARSPERVGPTPGRIARYARGRDYHNVLSKRLRKLERYLRELGYAARHSVDSRPVFERAWAERAGVGFIGKNACLIVPGLGSHVFLSCIVTNAPLSVTAPIRRRCGDCRLCLDACPTSAFVDERALDATRCISYLTIEHEGDISESLMENMGDWLLGCDVCQDVCPYNTEGTRKHTGETTEPFAPDARFFEVSAEELLAMNPESYAEFTVGSPMRRPGRDRMARNVCICLGNSGNKRHLKVLKHQEHHDESEEVRRAARWAKEKLEHLEC